MADAHLSCYLSRMRADKSPVSVKSAENGRFRASALSWGVASEYRNSPRPRKEVKRLQCEMCFQRTADEWVLVEEDYEVELCIECIAELTHAGISAEIMETD